MAASDVAGAVRGRALARRRIGAAGARRLAGLPSPGAVVDELATTPYGRYVRPGQTPAEAETAVLRTLLWHLRVLAGWQSRVPAQQLRLVIAGFELANLEEHVHHLDGGAASEPFELGRSAQAWSRLAGTSSAAEVRCVLARSVWGDPGSQAPRALTTVPRLRWLRMVAARIPEAAEWAYGAAVLVLARERLLSRRTLLDRERAELLALTGPASLAATGLDELRAAAGRRAGWILAGIPADQLWRAEARWWGRVDRDGEALLRASGLAGTTAVGCAAVLAADAWRVRVALAAVAHQAPGAEVLDAMA